MPRLLILCLCCLCLANFAQAQPNNTSYKASPQMPDIAVPLALDQVHLTGYLGDRVGKNEANRLRNVELEPLLAGYKKRPGNHPWIGEHIGKWLHASTLAWVNTGDKALKAKIDGAVKALIATQEPDGYLGTYVQGKRFGLYDGSDWDVWSHKYNLLGLLTYYQYTGDQAALQASQRMGDLLAETFGAGRKSILSAGTHKGMAATSVLEPIVLLYRFSNEERYLQFARYIVEAWDEPEGPAILKTLTALGAVEKTANGKAYEMLSNLVGLCELARATGEQKYLVVAQNGWKSVVRDHLYITGTASHGEHFHAPHDLPNQPGANIGETCVTVTWIQLTSQLLRLTGEAKYGEELERSYYNHLAAAQRPDGKEWCYYTALEGAKPYGPGINCCVSSGPRGMAMTPLMACFTTHENTGDTLLLNLFEPFQAQLTLGGVPVQVTQASRFPFEGGSRLTFTTTASARFGLKIRKPVWAQRMRVEGASGQEEGGWILVPAREWKSGAGVSIHFGIKPEIVQGIYSNAGHIALRYGAIILAYEREKGAPPVSDRILVLDKSPNMKPLLSRSGKSTFQVLADVQIGEEKHRARFIPFSEVGAEGNPYRIWIREAGSPLPDRLSLLAWGVESRSRNGNASGSILDEDLHSFVVTFDSQAQAQDWYAVNLPKTAAIQSIVYAHGRTFHDGGWFDASKGKPQVQVQYTLNGAWEAVGTLDTYPDTTATDSRNLKDGDRFTLKFRSPLRVFGVRVIGTPAHGDNPRQSFSSCAELQAYAQ